MNFVVLEIEEIFYYSLDFVMIFFPSSGWLNRDGFGTVVAAAVNI